MASSPLFWITALVLVAATLALLVVPLLRRARPETGPADEAAVTAVFRDHRRQLDAELAAGAISADDHATSLAELTQRFGAELAAPPASAAAAPGRSGFMAALVLVALLPVTAGVLYFVLGNPDALSPQATRPVPATTTNAQVDTMVEELAARLKANPEDGEGWAMLARSYRVLGRYEPAAMAYGEAVKRIPANAGLLVDWAEAIAQVQGRSLAGQPSEILERALKLDPGNPKALALAGAAAMERGDRPQAIALWTRLRSVLPPDSPQLAQIDAALTRAGVTIPGAPAGAASTGGPPPAGAAGAAGAVAGTGAAGAAAGAPAGTGAAAGTRAAAGAGAAGAPAAGSAVSGRVELDPRLAGNVAPSDTVFIFARNPDGPRMPLAVLKVPASELPRRFELTDAMAMAPGATLSSAARVVVEARISKSGNAKSAAGDLEGASAQVVPGTRDVLVRIDRVVP